MRCVFVFLSLLSFITGCGSDGGSPPTISNISYSPTTALIGGGGGSLTMVATVDFVDPDGDLFYVHVSDKDCGQGSWEYLDSILSGVTGVTSGTIQFLALVSTNCPPGTYTVKVSVFDRQGHESNELHAPITLTP